MLGKISFKPVDIIMVFAHPSLNGVRGADIFLPYSGKVHQDWILREIGNRVNTKEVVSSAPHVLTLIHTY